MTSPFVRWCVVTLACFGYAACSSDGGAPAEPTQGTGGKAGGSSSGGARNTGGQTGSGGFDPAMAAQCGIDSTGSDCKLCLAALCCDAVKPCFDDSACMAEFSKYQSCLKEPGQVNPAGCLAAFATFAASDGGPHYDLIGCINFNCDICGGVSVL